MTAVSSYSEAISRLIQQRDAQQRNSYAPFCAEYGTLLDRKVAIEKQLEQHVDELHKLRTEFGDAPRELLSQLKTQVTMLTKQIETLNADLNESSRVNLQQQRNVADMLEAKGKAVSEAEDYRQRLEAATKEIEDLKPQLKDKIDVVEVLSIEREQLKVCCGLCLCVVFVTCCVIYLLHVYYPEIYRTNGICMKQDTKKKPQKPI
eukprot:TRINITY_DN6201_c0_g1_i1.p2 TRINITY_DN6201_c0_g1~~TRINITY_DN6201_c0_g1_i1.p2  ORF type:complete len:214 (+),score=44.98 TRINITY_DN6201_c0_g1_i1:30-644(+)